MSGPTGWGPGASSGPAAFAISAPPQLELGPARAGATTYTVTNLTGRPLKARLLPRALQGADASWISVAGPAEIPMGVGATVTVTVNVAVPPGAPAGNHLARLDVVPEDDTEAEVAGPSVAFVVPPPVAPKSNRWLLPLLIGLVVLVLVGGVATYLILRQEQP